MEKSRGSVRFHRAGLIAHFSVTICAVALFAFAVGDEDRGVMALGAAMVVLGLINVAVQWVQLRRAHRDSPPDS